MAEIFQFSVDPIYIGIVTAVAIAVLAAMLIGMGVAGFFDNPSPRQPRPPIEIRSFNVASYSILSSAVCVDSSYSWDYRKLYVIANLDSVDPSAFVLRDLTAAQLTTTALEFANYEYQAVQRGSADEWIALFYEPSLLALQGSMSTGLFTGVVAGCDEDPARPYIMAQFNIVGSSFNFFLFGVQLGRCEDLQRQDAGLLVNTIQGLVPGNSRLLLTGGFPTTGFNAPAWVAQQLGTTFGVLDSGNTYFELDEKSCSFPVLSPVSRPDVFITNVRPEVFKPTVLRTFPGSMPNNYPASNHNMLVATAQYLAVPLPE